MFWMRVIEHVFTSSKTLALHNFPNLEVPTDLGFLYFEGVTELFLDESLGMRIMGSRKHVPANEVGLQVNRRFIGKTIGEHLLHLFYDTCFFVLCLLPTLRRYSHEVTDCTFCVLRFVDWKWFVAFVVGHCCCSARS